MYAQAATGSDLIQFVSAAPDTGSTREQLAARLSEALAIDVSVITGFWDTQFGAGGIDRATIITSDHLLALRRCAELSTLLGATPATLNGWARAWPTAADAVGVRNAIRSRLSSEQWLITSTQVQDELREHRRDALVRYLLATAGPDDPKSSAELYGAYLLDVEMDDCMDTSRIVQANAAIQLFVQRCFLGLEDIARDLLHSDHWRQWDWRQRYRLWEANRLVFLYPENFLSVARRSNASALFDGYAKEVRQSDKDDDSVREALDTYLKGLEDISNLDYLAVSSNLEEGAGYEPQLHVVARSRATPPAHFHRTLAGGVWTPWEPIDIGTPGNHFALLHRRGRTTLVWPMFADYPDPRQKLPPATENTSSPEAPLPRGVSYLTYGWVVRDRRKWSSVQTSTRALLHQKRGRGRFVTAPVVSANVVNLDVYSPAAPVLAADQDASPDAPYLGTMELQRDVVSIVVNQSNRGLDPWLGADHQYQMDTTATLAPVRFNVGADCTCVFWADSTYTPWPGLVFNDNRMRSALTAKQLKIRVPLTGNSSVDRPVLDSGFFVVAADSTRRALDVSTSQSGFKDYTSYFVMQTSYTPASDAFAVNDQYRSFIGLSRAALGSLAGQVPHPGSDMVLTPAYHPFAAELREVVHSYDDGIDRLYTKQTQESPGTLGRAPLSYVSAYGDHSPFAVFDTPAEGMDFDPICAYALYNWEVFFHAPLFVAEQLRTAGRHEQARRYYHFLFTPFTSEPADPAHPRARFWVLKPFRHDPGTSKDIRDIILDGAINHINPYTAIESHPFDAQLVAQSQPSAYQKFVVMRYLDNLMAWGDSLYRKGQREDVYEAIQHYLLAQQILGERPDQLRPLGRRVDRPFEGTDWSGGANALVDLENLIADAGEEPPAEGDVPLVDLPLIRGLYFCVPPNKTLLKYWEDVGRRLYNIRHCLTIDGAPVRYDLLAAPIDPQALVDAAAAGVSVAEALTMAGSPIPPHRFNVMWAKAWDACNEVKGLGGALLSALEKRDGEQLSAIRSTWEGKLLDKTRRTRELTRDLAAADVESLTEARKTIDQRRAYYSSRDYMNDLEKAVLGLGVAAGVLDTTGLVFDVLGGVLYLIPNIDLGISGFGGTPTAKAAMSGENIGGSVSRTSQGLSRAAGLLDRASAMVSAQGSFARRQEEWDQQAAQASLELAHMDKQIAAANLRIAIASAELRGHEVQEQTWKATDELLSAKFSNQERYGYLIDVLGELYRTAYEHAVDMAKLARECLAFELPHATVSPIRTTHWDSLQHGLLAGERLAGDLRDLDRVHATERGYERVVVQHVPLSHVAPQQLIDLRQTGACAFSIPAWWFQRFDPNLTHRRIRSVAVTVPSVTGPYVGMNATLRYQGVHRTRTAISLSTGVNDTGGAVAPDQYAPFEGISLDVQSSWTFGFPQESAGSTRRLTDVDYSTITDVILHIQYVADVAAQPVLGGPPELITFIDLRSMAPDAWAELSATTSHSTSLVVSALVPRFLKDYEVDSILPSTIAVLTSGAVVTPKLAFTVGAGAELGTVTIKLAADQTLDWSKLAKVMMAIKMKRPAS
ncbi:neuraminidase-like domain-containing protein [Nonomuraea sp. NPDC051941]|uniref:Tc toxin subunit A-related protein n=1 Tax=Nonomuraea sp. NPDC051941 TaxID=3364373 RepID=UPI0037CB68F7